MLELTNDWHFLFFFRFQYFFTLKLYIFYLLESRHANVGHVETARTQREPLLHYLNTYIHIGTHTHSLRDLDIKLTSSLFFLWEEEQCLVNSFSASWASSFKEVYIFSFTFETKKKKWPYFHLCFILLLNMQNASMDLGLLKKPPNLRLCH